MKTVWKLGVACVALVSMIEAAAASDSCLKRKEMVALKVAAIQQQLMVAALTCHAIPRYNQFVLSHRKQLLVSDNALKAYFVRSGGIARYHAYKTKLANNSSLTSIGDVDSYCRDAFAAFDVAAGEPSLAVFVAERSIMVDVASPACVETRMAAREERRAARHRARVYARR